MNASFILGHLARIARPALALTGGLLASGAILAVAGIGAGWAVWAAGYASAIVSLPAFAVVQRERLGRFGAFAFGLLAVTVVLGVPVAMMVAAFVLELGALHDLLMPYALTPIGMVGAFGPLLGLVVAGLATVRAAAVPAASGWLIAAAGAIEVPVELGVLPFPGWALAMTLLAAGLGIAAHSLPASSRRRRAGLAVA
jgi:hypothetical protein